jgi:hypothetical protein
LVRPAEQVHRHTRDGEAEREESGGRIEGLIEATLSSWFRYSGSYVKWSFE